MEAARHGPRYPCRAGSSTPSSSEAHVRAELGAPGVVLTIGLSEVRGQVEALETAEVLEIRHVEHFGLNARPDAGGDRKVLREPQVEALFLNWFCSKADLLALAGGRLCSLRSQFVISRT